MQSLKKPDLPNFDKKNIETWLKRVEAAYTRVNCTSPALKFAHLESKFEVDEDPVIDGYLYGEATQDNWNKFTAYLRKRYGKSKKDKTLLLLNGIPREGRTPSQLAAVIKDKTQDVTVDDIRKEQLLKQLPPAVLNQIIDRVEKLSFDETATLADAWFDKEGNVLLSNNATGINSVTNEAPNPSPTSTASNHTLPFSDDDPNDINAIRGQQARKNTYNSSNSGRGSNRGRGRGGNSNRGSSNSNNRNTNSYGSSASYGTSGSNSSNSSSGNGKGYQPKVCYFHNKFGDKAERCDESCMLFAQHKQQQAGKGRASH